MDAFCFTLLAEKIDNNPEFKDKIMDIEKFESLIHQDFFERNDNFAYWLNFYHLHIWIVEHQKDQKDLKEQNNLKKKNKNTIQYFQLTNADLDKLWMDFNLDNLEKMLHTTQSNFIKISSFNGKIKINKWLNILTFNRYKKIKKEHLIQLKEFILDAKKSYQTWISSILCGFLIIWFIIIFYINNKLWIVKT